MGTSQKDNKNSKKKSSYIPVKLGHPGKSVGARPSNVFEKQKIKADQTYFKGLKVHSKNKRKMRKFVSCYKDRATGTIRPITSDPFK